METSAAWRGPLQRKEAVAPVLALTLFVYGDIVSQVENAIFGFFQSIWDGISSFFGQIFQGFANLIVSIFELPVTALQSSFAALTSFANAFGPLSPIIVLLVITAVVLLGVWLLWIVIKLSVSEGEQTGEELEEGV